MSLRSSLAQQISLFRSRVQRRSFDDVTIEILKSVSVSKDADSFIGVRSTLKQFMRDECLSIFKEIAQENVEIKLLYAEYLICTFAIIGDVESCLALRYEALVMREQQASTDPGLQVSCKEWLTFIEHSFENGFYSIANQACEKALTFYGGNHVAHCNMGDVFSDEHAVKKIKRLKDSTVLTISSQSVQAQGAMYLKQKNTAQKPNSATSVEAQDSGYSMFRRGIKKRNLRTLHNYQSLQR